MSFLIQHGWGKGSDQNDRIRRSLEGNIGSGVIFGPDAEAPGSLESYISALRLEYPDAELLIDPQVYVATLEAPNYKRLVEYQDRYFEVNLGRGSFRPRFIQALVRRTIDWQLGSNVSGVICPGVRIQGFGSPMAQIAIALAQEACDYAQEMGVEQPLYATIAVSEESFRDTEMMNEYLDELTTLEVDGFYFVIFERGAGYRSAVAQDILPNVLRFIYSLGEVNLYRLLAGYADLNGYLYRIVGASAFASGWSQSLRRLTEDKWAERTGGRRPRPRYTSVPLFNSIPIDPDLRRIYEEGQITRVLANSPFDGVLARDTPPTGVNWTEFLDHMQYLYVCSQVEAMVPRENLEARCRRARSTIVRAIQLYADLSDNHNIIFSPQSDARHLGIWQVGLQDFCAQVGISL